MTVRMHVTTVTTVLGWPMPGGARKYVEMDERDEAARPRQAAETDWFRVLTFGCAPRCKRTPSARTPARSPHGLPRRAAPRARQRARNASHAPAQAPQPAAGDGVFAADCF